jgi:hypothetical protein
VVTVSIGDDDVPSLLGHETLPRNAGLVTATAAAFLEDLACLLGYDIAVWVDFVDVVVAELVSVMKLVSYYHGLALKVGVNLRRQRSYCCILAYGKCGQGYRNCHDNTQLLPTHRLSNWCRPGRLCRTGRNHLLFKKQRVSFLRDQTRVGGRACVG